MKHSSTESYEEQELKEENSQDKRVLMKDRYDKEVVKDK